MAHYPRNPKLVDLVEAADMAQALVADHWDPADRDRDSYIDPAHQAFARRWKQRPR